MVSGYDAQPHSHHLYDYYYRPQYKPCRPGEGYCNEANCRRKDCRRRYRWSKRKMMDLGVEKAQQRGDGFSLMTLTPLEPGQPTHALDVIDTLVAHVNAVRKGTHRRIVQHHQDVMWWRCWGLKDTPPFQLHAHILWTYAINADLATRIKQSAMRHDLNAHITPVYDPQPLAKYLAFKNLGELDVIQLPPRFQRFRASNNAPKLDYQIRRAQQRQSRGECLKPKKSPSLF